MSGPAANALTVMLFGLSGLFLLYAASLWVRLSRDQERPDQRPAISVAAFRSAAGVTGVTLGLLGMALCWFAFTRL